MIDGNVWPRDFIGYGERTPQPQWPGRARLALQIVLNYEEGAERCILNGDDGSEAYLSELVGIQSLKGARNLNVESLYEYGARAGFWRLYRILREHLVPVTVFGVAQALALNPKATQAMHEANWEIASHGLRWIDYKDFSREEEARHFDEVLGIHSSLGIPPPSGWYTGRISRHTLGLAMATRSVIYSSDSYADDLPYWVQGPERPFLMIPYTLDANDMRFVSSQGLNTAEQFFCYLKDSFDLLYAEGAHEPKMMSVGLHCRISGRPGRAAALARFLEYVATHDAVWMARRRDIAEHWYAHHLPSHLETNSSSRA